MSEAEHSWDYFLAHAGADKSIAEDLYTLLTPRCKVFLDSRCLILGDDWDEELASAQSSSLISVVLVSSSTDRAYYQREEIAAAIEMARNKKNKHRVVPVYLDDGAKVKVPYGLRLKHGLSMREIGNLEEVARQLSHLLDRIKGQEVEKQVLVVSQKAALEKLADGTGKEKFDGMKEITKLFGSLVIVLISILAVLLLLIVLCLATELVRENRMLATTILASMFTLVLACLMMTFMKSMSFAHQLAQSGSGK